jgi:hypothetical protein
MELRRISTEKTKAKLSEPHQYINKEWDQPLLTAEKYRKRKKENG